MMIPFHPLSELFPLLTGKQFDELVADIKLKGLQEPIVLYEDKVLEGRNRLRACMEAGVPPITKVYEGTDPIGFVFSANLVRRHLTTGQRAMAVAKFAQLRKGDVESQRVGRTNDRPPLLSAEEAANLAHVSTRTIGRAKIVTANGTEQEIADVKDGKSSLDKACRAVRARRGGDLRSGCRAKIPDGFKSLSAAVKPGIELERGGLSTREVAKTVGIGLQTYACVRDAILLSKRKDLSDRNLKIVQAALEEIDGTQRTQHAQSLIKPISLKVWGRKGNRFKTDKTRVAAFSDSIIFVVSGCTAIADCEIPALEKKQRMEVGHDLTSAISALSRLRRRVKREEG